MKVLLIRPQAPNTLSFTKVLDNEPLELEYLHTALNKRGIDDYIFDGLVESGVKEAILREKPQVVAVTGYITQQNLMIEYCKLAKELDHSIVTVVGGVHAQLNYKAFFCDWIDYIFRSEDVDAFAALAELIDRNECDTDTLKTINGLCFKTDGVYSMNELIPVEINRLPIPDRSHFYRHKSSYRYLDLTEVATVKTAVSCPYSCSFCYCTWLAGGTYKARDLNLVIEELKGLDAENVQIVDDDFLVDRKRLLRFIELVKENDIKKTYICYSRADFVCDNPDIVKALADIGFKYFLVGLEAVTDKELENFHKETSADMNERCVQIINEAGAHCVALMIAPLDADREYFETLYRWVVKTGLNYVTVSIFTPIPGTPLYEQNKSKITSDNIEDWDFLHLVMEPVKLTKRQFYYEYYKLFLRLYKIARKTGIYNFMNIRFYKKMLGDYLKRKMRGKV